MKLKLLQIVMVAVFLLFTGAGCQEEIIELADESIVVDNLPGLSIYKSDSDLFNYLALRLSDDGEIIGRPDYNLEDSRIEVDQNGKIYYNRRYLLKDGYIIDREMNYEKVFTDITFQEYVSYYEKNGKYMSAEMLKSRITNENPFIEYYYSNNINDGYMKFTLREINEMLETRTIEEHFTRLK